MAPPKVRQFKNSYAKTVADVPADTLESSLRSYMDSGEGFFDEERFDGKSRNEVIRKVRQNILRRMREENAASFNSAEAERAKHAQYSTKILRKIGEAKQIQREIKRSDIDYAALRGKEHVNDKANVLSYLDDLIRNASADIEADRQLMQGDQAQAQDQAPGDIEGQEDENGEPGNEELDQAMIQQGEEEQEEEVDEEQQRWRRERYLTAPKRERSRNAGEVSQTSLNERQSDLEYLQRIRAEVERTNTAGKSKIGRFFRMVSVRSGANRSRNDSRRQKYTAKIREINNVSSSWATERENYSKNIFRKHYENYDKMAKSWYEMTQEFSVEANGELPQDAVEGRTIDPTSAKAIEEYTGVFNDTALTDILNNIASNPYVNVENLPIKESKIARGEEEGGNRTDPARHVKIHRKIVMYSMAGRDGLKTRYKFGRDLRGRRSKKQFTANLPTALTEAQNVAPDFFDEVYAGRANLESDERDINGRKLFSEKSAEVLHAKVARDKQRVHGFLLNGEFYTDEEAAEGVKLAGRNDMKYFGRRSFTKQEKAEKLRVAIRKSAFFQHVNAATIQYYTSYNAGDDFLDDVQDNIDKKWEKAQERDANYTKEHVAELIRVSPQSIAGVPKDLQGSVLCQYIMTKIDNPEPNPFPAGNPLTDPAVQWLCEHDGRAPLLTCMTLLLAEDGNPVLWNIARKMAEDGSIVDDRTKEMLKRLPKNGQMMRMGLIDELVNHQGATSEFDWELPLGFIKGPKLSVEQEELENKRGFGAWFKKNLLNGRFIKEAISLVGMGVEVGELGSDMKNTTGEKDWAVDDDTKDMRDERKCWFLYGEAMAEGSVLGGILGAGAVAVGGLVGGADGASKARDGYFQVADALGMINDLKVVFGPIWKALKKAWKTIKHKLGKETEEERQEYERAHQEAQDENENGLKDLDYGMFRAVLKYLYSVINLADGIRDIASYHLDTNSEKGKWKDWGNLIAWRGPLQWVFDTARNLLNIVNDFAEIIASTKRIHRIDKADETLKSALEDFEANGNGDNLQQQADQEQAEQQDQPEDERFEIMNPARDEEIKKRKLGEAVAENSQAQYFMALTKAQSQKSRHDAGWNAAISAVKMGRDTFKQFAKTGEVVSLAITAVLTVAPKAMEFLSWVSGKLFHDRPNFKNNIAMMLGDKKYASTPYFDKVLKRETGIVSSDYLVDVARVFTAIDTHVLLNKEGKNSGEKELALKVAGTLYGNVNEDNIKKIKLDQMMKYTGFSGDSNWRSLLRHSITG